MIINDDGDEVSWELADLNRWGLIKTNNEWSEFVEYMNDSAMRFFEEKIYANENN